ncbi:MAG: lysophospholipid acyltransferase family protein [Bacilli bacterium]
MKRPNKFVYVILNYFARLYTLIVKKHRFHNPDKIKIETPSIVISNHTSFFDFLYVMWAFKHTPVNFVVARKYYETKPLSKILKLGHTIPKSLFQADTMAMKNMLEVIKKGGVVGLFPEGQISITGVTLPFASGIGKFVKKVGVMVYAVKTTGAYLKDPPWTKITRKGRIDSHLFQALTPDEAKGLSPEEIEEKLFHTIFTNPFIDGKAYIFKGKKLAKGLENILYLCPKCHSEGEMISNKNELMCSECHFKYEVQVNGWLHHDEEKTNIQEAYLYERTFEKNKILNSPSFMLEVDVKVESINHYQYQIISQGKLRISQNSIEYLSDDKFSFSIPTNVVRYVPFDAGINFQIYMNNMLYQFIPNKPYLATQAVIMIEELYKLSKQPLK